MLLPPDTDSRWEMWLVFQIVASVRNPWILVVLFLLAIGYAVYKLVAVTLVRIVEIFRERAISGKPRAHLLRWALGLLAVSWAVAALLFWYGHAWHVRSGVALDLFACAAFVFIVFCVVIDWTEERRERNAQPVLPEHLSIGDVISWHTEIDNAHPATSEEGR
jgi:hypothetical protein